MRRTSLAALAGASTLLLCLAGCTAPNEDVGSSTNAISGGESDYEHTNVGAVALQVAPDVWYHICSGTLIAPDVVLTAGHCTVSFPRLGVTFTRDIAPGAPMPSSLTVHAGDTVTHPDYDPNGDGAKARNDLGLILLDEPVDAPVATLPDAGALSELKASGELGRDSVATVVGYGLEEAKGLGNGALEPSNERKFATMSYNALTNAVLKTSPHRGASNGGTACFGDSGGATFLWVDGQETLVGAVSIGDGSCADLLFSYRTDTQAARSFLGQYVTLP